MKPDIKDVFRLSDNNEIFEFCKSYAFNNPKFAQILIAEFLPKESDPFKTKFSDIDMEFARCLSQTNKNTHYQYWGPELDWNAIDHDLYRLVEKGRYMLNNGLIADAIYLALMLLRKVGEAYGEDAVYEDQSLDGEHFSTYEALLLLKEAMKHTSIGNDEKLRIANELVQISELEAYKSYSLCDFDNLIESTKKSLLPADEYIKYLTSELNKAESFSKDEYAIKLFHFFLESNCKSEAENWAKEHFEYNRLFDTYVDWLIGEQRLNDALLTLDIGISKHPERNACKNYWLIKKLEIYESQHDTANIIELCYTLFLSQNSCIAYYHRLKTLINKTVWDGYFDKMMKHKHFDGDACSTLTQIYYEEKRYTELFEILNKAKRNLLSALQIYAKSLTEEQQTILIVKIESTLISFAEHQMGRNNYKDLANRLNSLKRCCNIGKVHGEKLVELFRANYRNRPAMIDELKSL